MKAVVTSFFCKNLVEYQDIRWGLHVFHVGLAKMYVGGIKEYLLIKKPAKVTGFRQDEQNRYEVDRFGFITSELQIPKKR